MDFSNLNISWNPESCLKFRGIRNLVQDFKVVADPSDADEESDDLLTSIDAVKQTGGKVPPLKVHVQIDKCKIPMEIDTGASVSIMSEGSHQRLCQLNN